VPEPEVGWPIAEPEADEGDGDEAYPLRPEADVRDAEAEEYTRVIAAPEGAKPNDDSSR
jgi:hypothetical protein